MDMHTIFQCQFLNMSPCIVWIFSKSHIKNIQVLFYIHCFIFPLFPLPILFHLFVRFIFLRAKFNCFSYLTASLSIFICLSSPLFIYWMLQDNNGWSVVLKASVKKCQTRDKFPRTLVASDWPNCCKSLTLVDAHVED